MLAFAFRKCLSTSHGLLVKLILQPTIATQIPGVPQTALKDSPSYSRTNMSAHDYRPILPSRSIRRTRFVLVSDTFDYRPPLPSGDVLCHAGGLSLQGDINDLRRTLEWISKANFEIKIIIAGQSNITRLQLTET
ncbi:hypothetical protein E4T48_07654 [Aureobasidium sp. EXF-10727]|nr:hypothetical protein E4T48_07654 [Aureobasidium sp. EXF-10727]